MATATQSRFDRQNDAIRHVSILTIAEHFGISLRVGRNGLFFLEGEKGASLKIDIRKNFFYYHGESVDFTTPLAYKRTSAPVQDGSASGPKKGDPAKGGDAIDFAVFALYYTRGILANPKTEDGMKILSSEFAKISPSINHLISEDIARSFIKRHTAAEKDNITLLPSSPFGGSIVRADSKQKAQQGQVAELAENILDDNKLGTFSTYSLHPFWYQGYFFFSVEQFVQWAKASLCNDQSTADQILHLGEELKDKCRLVSDGETEPDREEKWFESIDLFSVENMHLCLDLTKKSIALNNTLTDFESVKDIWEREDMAAAIAIGTHLMLQGNPELMKELLRSEDDYIAALSGSTTRPEETVFYQTLAQEKDFFKNNGYEDYGVDKKHVKVLDAVKGLRDRLHINYLTKERGLPEDLTKNFYEVTYVWCSQEDPNGEKSKTYTAIATPSVDGNWNILIHYRQKFYICKDASGAEIQVDTTKYSENANGPVLRAAYETVKIKSTTGQNISLVDKDYNFVVNQEFTPTASTLIAVEGQLNAASLLALQQRDKPGTFDILTLNSVSNLGRALPYMKQYKSVILYFDNDKAGQVATRDAASFLLSKGIPVFDGRIQFMENGPLVPLSLKETQDPIEAFSHDNLLVSTGGKKEKFDAYWAPRLNKGPNDLNDTLMDRQRAKANKVARQQATTGSNTQTHRR